MAREPRTCHLQRPFDGFESCEISSQLEESQLFWFDLEAICRRDPQKLRNCCKKVTEYEMSRVEGLLSCAFFQGPGNKNIDVLMEAHG